MSLDDDGGHLLNGGQPWNPSNGRPLSHRIGHWVDAIHLKWDTFSPLLSIRDVKSRMKYIVSP